MEPALRNFSSKDQMDRHRSGLLHPRSVIVDFAVAVGSHGGVAFGHEALAVAGHEHVAVHVRQIDPARKRNLRGLEEEFRTGDVAHVPEVGAGFDAHAYAVSGVVWGANRVHVRKPCQIGVDHGRIVLEALYVVWPKDDLAADATVAALISLGSLLQQQDIRSGVVGGDRGGAAGKAIADDDHVGLLVPFRWDLRHVDDSRFSGKTYVAKAESGSRPVDASGHRSDPSERDQCISPTKDDSPGNYARTACRSDSRPMRTSDEPRKQARAF